MRQNAFVYKRHIPCEHVDQDGPLPGTYVTSYDQWDHPGVFANSTYNHLFPIPGLSQKPTNIHWDSQHTNFCDRLRKTWGSCHSNYWTSRYRESMVLYLPPSPTRFQTAVCLWVALLSFQSAQGTPRLSPHFGSFSNSQPHKPVLSGGAPLGNTPVLPLLLKSSSLQWGVTQKEGN